MVLISIIIPVRNRKEITRNILTQIFTQISLNNCTSNVSVIVVNDGSTDGTKEMIIDQHHIKLNRILPKNLVCLVHYLLF